MIQEQLAHLPEFLPDYRPFPPVKEHTAWQGLPLRAKQRFLQAGEAALFQICRVREYFNSFRHF